MTHKIKNPLIIIIVIIALAVVAFLFSRSTAVAPEIEGTPIITEETESTTLSTENLVTNEPQPEGDITDISVE